MVPMDFSSLHPDRPFASVPYAMVLRGIGNSGRFHYRVRCWNLRSLLILIHRLADGSVSKAKMDPNLVRYFVPEISTNPSAVSIIQGQAQPFPSRQMENFYLISGKRME